MLPGLTCRAVRKGSCSSAPAKPWPRAPRKAACCPKSSSVAPRRRRYSPQYRSATSGACPAACRNRCAWGHGTAGISTQPQPPAPRPQPQPQPYLLLHHAAPALRHAPQPARRLRHRPGQRLLVPALLPACQAQPGLSAAPHTVPAARPRGGSAASPPVPQGPLQSSPRLQPRAHGPSEGSPSLTRRPRLLRLGAAGVHVHQELGQEPHAGAEGVAAGRGARGRLPAPQVLAQQPGQGADAAGVCGAAGLRAGARGRGSAGRGASGYLGW